MMRVKTALLLICLSVGSAFGGTKARLTFNVAGAAVWEVDKSGAGTNYVSVPYDKADDMVLREDLAWNITGISVLIPIPSTKCTKLGLGEQPKEILYAADPDDPTKRPYVKLVLGRPGGRMQWEMRGVPVRHLCDAKSVPNGCGLNSSSEVGIPLEAFGQASVVRVKGDKGTSAECRPSEVGEIRFTTGN